MPLGEPPEPEETPSPKPPEHVAEPTPPPTPPPPLAPPPAPPPRADEKAARDMLLTCAEAGGRGRPVLGSTAGGGGSEGQNSGDCGRWPDDWPMPYKGGDLGNSIGGGGEVPLSCIPSSRASLAREAPSQAPRLANAGAEPGTCSSAHARAAPYALCGSAIASRLSSALRARPSGAVAEPWNRPAAAPP